MLISKKTWCFSCDKGELDRRYFYGDADFEILVHECSSCGAKKKTLGGKGWGEKVIGTVSYEHPVED